MSSVRELSVEELKALIGEVVEEKLREMLGDPDEGLVLRPDIQERLVKSLSQPKESRQTVSAPEAARRLGLDW
jgi:vacuolar-type H+-ATPase subunit E/Vma4